MAKRIFDWTSPDAGEGGYLTLAEPGDAVGGGSGIAVGAIVSPSPLPNNNDVVAPGDVTKPYWVAIEVSGTWDDATPFGTLSLNVVSPDIKTTQTIARESTSRTPDSAGYRVTLEAILAPGEHWQVVGPNGYVNITAVTERALA